MTPPDLDELPAGLDRRLVALFRPASWETERYRMLRRSLERTYPLERRKVIAVTSANAGEGKTTTAINLAAVLAEVPETSVALVDADFRCGSVARLLDIVPSAEDLADAIDKGTRSLGQVTNHSPAHPRLGIIPVWPRPETAHVLVESPNFARLMVEARARYNFVVVDTPPLLPVSDCRAIAPWVDGFLVVVTAHGTTRDRLGEALNMLEPKKLLGLVFNGDDEPVWRGPSHYYAHYGRTP